MSYDDYTIVNTTGSWNEYTYTPYETGYGRYPYTLNPYGTVNNTPTTYTRGDYIFNTNTIQSSVDQQKIIALERQVKYLEKRVAQFQRFEKLDIGSLVYYDVKKYI
jgi:hypothetical protein